jgi:hypothetical protein
LKRTLLPLALVASLAFAGTALAAPRNHAVNARAKVAGLGPEAGKQIALAKIAGTPFGADTVALLRYRVSGTHVTGTFVAYNSHGSVHGTITQTVSPQPDQSVKFSGSARVLGGTGTYNNSTGVLTFAGTEAVNDPVINYRITGNIRY